MARTRICAISSHLSASPAEGIQQAARAKGFKVVGLAAAKVAAEPLQRSMSEALLTALASCEDYVLVSGLLYCVDCGRPIGEEHHPSCNDARRERMRSVRQARVLRAEMQGGAA